MNILSLFHRRKEEKEGKVSSIYTYTLSLEFRKRIVMYIEEIVKNSDNLFVNEAINVIEVIVKQLRMSFAVFKLDELSINTNTNNTYEELLNFIYKCEDTDKVLSSIELLCRYSNYINILTDDINEIFRYDRIGYKYLDGKVVKIEDEIFFEECTNKSLSLLAEKYKISHDLLLLSYEKLLKDEYSDAILNSCKAIENLLKIRLNEIGIETSKKSLYLLLNEAKIHINCNYNFNKFLELIEEVGVARNKNGGHLEISENNVSLTEEFCRFIINQASANLLFLAEVEMTSDN